MTINNEVTGSTNEGVIVQSVNEGAQNLNFEEGSITNNGSGIRIFANNNLDQFVSITDSTIGDNRGIGIEIDGNLPTSTTETTSQEVVIFDNDIVGNAGDGINIEAYGIAVQGFTIANNNILDNEGAGVRSLVAGDSLQEFNPSTGDELGFDIEFALGNNTIMGNAEEAIVLSVGDNSGAAAILFAEIDSNTISDNNTDNSSSATGSEIVVTNIDTNASTCAYIVDNTVPAGIELNIDDPPALFEVQIDGLPNSTPVSEADISEANNFAPVTLTGFNFATPNDGVCFAN